MFNNRVMLKPSRHLGLSYFNNAFAAPKRPKHLERKQVKPALRPTFCQSQAVPVSPARHNTLGRSNPITIISQPRLGTEQSLKF